MSLISQILTPDNDFLVVFGNFSHKYAYFSHLSSILANSKCIHRAFLYQLKDTLFSLVTKGGLSEDKLLQKQAEIVHLGLIME